MKPRLMEMLCCSSSKKRLRLKTKRNKTKPVGAQLRFIHTDDQDITKTLHTAQTSRENLTSNMPHQGTSTTMVHPQSVPPPSTSVATDIKLLCLFCFSRNLCNSVSGSPSLDPLVAGPVSSSWLWWMNGVTVQILVWQASGNANTGSQTEQCKRHLTVFGAIGSCVRFSLAFGGHLDFSKRHTADFGCVQSETDTRNTSVDTHKIDLPIEGSVCVEPRLERDRSAK